MARTSSALELCLENPEACNSRTIRKRSARYSETAHSSESVNLIELCSARESRLTEMPVAVSTSACVNPRKRLSLQSGVICRQGRGTLKKKL